MCKFGRRHEANCSETYRLTDTVYPSVVVILNASFFTSLKLAHKHTLFGLTLYKKNCLLNFDVTLRGNFAFYQTTKACGDGGATGVKLT